MADTGERRRVLRRYVEEQPDPPSQPGDTGRMLALPDGRMAFIPNPNPSVVARPVCDYHSGFDVRLDHLEADVKALQGLPLALQQEVADREAADAKLGAAVHRRIAAVEQRTTDCESVTKPWRNVLINVGTAAALAVAAYAKAKGWI